MFYVHPYLGKISNLTSLFMFMQMGCFKLGRVFPPKHGGVELSYPGCEMSFSKALSAEVGVQDAPRQWSGWSGWSEVPLEFSAIRAPGLVISGVKRGPFKRPFKQGNEGDNGDNPTFSGYNSIDNVFFFGGGGKIQKFRVMFFFISLP